MQRWQLGFQRELGGGFVGELGYVGNKDGIEITRNINALPLQYLSTSALRDDQRIAYLTQQIANPFRGLVPTTPALNNAERLPRERLLRPFPHFNEVNTTTNQGYSFVYSLQMQLEKRFSRGYTIQANYTWSKFMQATEYLNPADPMPLETISDFDAPHRLAVSGIYELPFGKGKAFGGDASGLVNGLIGGWQLSGIYTFQAGTPLTFLNNSSNFTILGDISTIKVDNPTRERWFNIDSPAFGQRFITNASGALVVNPAINLANNVRTAPLRFSFLRGDVVNNWDLSAIKNTRFNERFNFQIRAEFLNAFNRVQFRRRTPILEIRLSGRSTPAIRVTIRAVFS